MEDIISSIVGIFILISFLGFVKNLFKKIFEVIISGVGGDAKKGVSKAKGTKARARRPRTARERAAKAKKAAETSKKTKIDIHKEEEERKELLKQMASGMRESADIRKDQGKEKDEKMPEIEYNISREESDYDESEFEFDLRKGIIYSEVLGKPLSKRKRFYSRG